MVLGEVRFLPALKHKHMTDMTDTRTPLQKELQAQLYTHKNWEDINSFVAETFPPKARFHTLTALEAMPMDTDHIDWQAVVDHCIRKFL